jgi:hypothetical protein
VSWKIRKIDHRMTLRLSWSNQLWIFFEIDHNAYIESCIRTLIKFLSILVLLWKEVISTKFFHAWASC